MLFIFFKCRILIDKIKNNFLLKLKKNKQSVQINIFHNIYQRETKKEIESP